MGRPGRRPAGGRLGRYARTPAKRRRPDARRRQARFAVPFQLHQPAAAREIFSKFRKIVVCELNEGQFANYLRQSLQEFRYEQYNKCEGLPFTVAELCQKFESLLK